MAFDSRAFVILYVDSHAASLVAFREAMGEAFSVATAKSGLEALQLLGKQHVALLVSESQLSDMTGIELFRQARELRPSTLRWLTTRDLDLSTALLAINQGQVSGYVAKPWLPAQLIEQLRGALQAQQLESSLIGLEMRLWHSGQVAAATTIYEELVHELSNPLGALEINASLVDDLLLTLLQDEALTPDVLQSSLESAREAQIDALAAIEQIKGLVSRMRHGRPSARPPLVGRCDVASCIDATVRIVRAEVEKVAELEVQLPASPQHVRMDASALGQVLLNL
ncbi:MAG: hypothetical protein RL701_5361, partial [Pseudomonadota bacterium]